MRLPFCHTLPHPFCFLLTRHAEEHSESSQGHLCAFLGAEWVKLYRSFIFSKCNLRGGEPRRKNDPCLWLGCKSKKALRAVGRHWKEKNKRIKNVGWIKRKFLAHPIVMVQSNIYWLVFHSGCQVPDSTKNETFPLVYKGNSTEGWRDFHRVSEHTWIFLK